MKTLYTLLLGGILIFVVSSCSKDGPEINKTYKNYYVNYNEQNNHFNIVADFKYDGPTSDNFKLHYPVFFGDQEMKWNSIDNNYRLDQKSYIPNGVFHWKDQEGAISQFKAEILITKFPANIEILNSNTDFELYFNGDELKYNETITFFITDANNKIKSFTQDVYQADYIKVTKEELKCLAKGQVEVYFHRIVKGPFTDHAQGGTFTVEYTSDVQTIMLN